MDQHPNLGLYYDDAKSRCPKCGGTHIHYRGYAYTPMGRFHRFQCQDCGGWGRDRSSALSKEERKEVAVSLYQGDDKPDEPYSWNVVWEEVINDTEMSRVLLNNIELKE